MRVTQRRGRPDLPQEALDTHALRHVLAQNLDGHPPIVPDVTRKEDRRHAPLSHLTLDRVAIHQRPGQLFAESGHQLSMVSGVALHHALDGRMVPRSKTAACGRHSGPRFKPSCRTSASPRAVCARHGSRYQTVCVVCPTPWK